MYRKFSRFEEGLVRNINLLNILPSLSYFTGVRLYCRTVLNLQKNTVTNPVHYVNVEVTVTDVQNLLMSIVRHRSVFKFANMYYYNCYYYHFKFKYNIHS